jgi:hypothetical protein
MIAGAIVGAWGLGMLVTGLMNRRGLSRQVLRDARRLARDDVEWLAQRVAQARAAGASDSDLREAGHHLAEATATLNSFRAFANEYQVARHVLAGDQALSGDRACRCFFDPRHGRAPETVSWTPPGASARPVPACATCVADVAAGRPPATRQVHYGRHNVEFWDAGLATLPWIAGWYRGDAGALQRLLKGTALGTVFSMHPVWRSYPDENEPYANTGWWDPVLLAGGTYVASAADLGSGMAGYNGFGDGGGGWGGGDGGGGGGGGVDGGSGGGGSF